MYYLKSVHLSYRDVICLTRWQVVINGVSICCVGDVIIRDANYSRNLRLFSTINELCSVLTLITFRTIIAVIKMHITLINVKHALIMPLQKNSTGK